MDNPLLRDLPGPAARALVDVGITDLHGLARHSRHEITRLHGVGPKAICILDDALADARLAFRPPDDAPLVDAYLAALGPPHRDTLAVLRATLRTLLPHAQEGMKYGMPATSVDGTGVAGYAAFPEHCGYYPMSGNVIAAAASGLTRHPHSKGAITFPPDKGLPGTLVAKLVRLRLAEIGNVRHGLRREYFPDGRLNAVGSMKDGELHGPWRWYRNDGSLLRTGRFDRGNKVGTWQTWNRDGSLGTSP